MAKPAERSSAEKNGRTGSVLGAVFDKLSVLNKTIKLDRADGKVRLAFDADRSSPADKGDAPQGEAATLLALRSELKELLDRCAGAREVLPHLAGVEHALKAQGLAAFDNLPPRVLTRAAAQLESVLAEPVSAGIAALRSRIGVALLRHERAALAVSRRDAPSSFLVDEKLQVSEGSVTDFMAVVEEAKRRS